MTGIDKLEMRIREFEEKIHEMQEATREANMMLRDLKVQRKEVERLLAMGDVKRLVDARVDEVVRGELDRIGPEIRAHTEIIYDKVGEQIDKLIAISLGKEGSLKSKYDDLRPKLAERLRVWIREVIAEEGYVYIPKKD